MGKLTLFGFLVLIGFSIYFLAENTHITERNLTVVAARENPTIRWLQRTAPKSQWHSTLLIPNLLRNQN